MEEQITVQDAIDYMQMILDDGYVKGTDFELNEDEMEMYQFIIDVLDDYGMEYGYDRFICRINRTRDTR